MRITSCGVTDVGVKRTNNEDNYLINDELNLFVVCDGMGGHVGGEFASAIAVNTVEEVLTSHEFRPEELAVEEDDGPVEIAREKLRYAIRLAGKRIFEKATEEPEYKGMGTTCLALLIDGGNAYIAHVGDSRAYLFRRGEFMRLTEDHSVENEARLRRAIRDAGYEPRAADAAVDAADESTWAGFGPIAIGLLLSAPYLVL